MARSWRWCLLLTLAVSRATIAAATHSHDVTTVSLAAPRLPSETVTPDAAQLQTRAANGSQSTDDHELRELLRWADSQQARDAAETQHPRHCTDCFLVVGVKIRVLRGFHERQGIRETWADAQTTLRHRSRVVFLGCEPDYSSLETADSHADALRGAVASEKRMFGDLLTDELANCVDSYYGLVDKTLAFFQWVTQNHGSAAYVMVTDDDAYVRIDKLTAMLQAQDTPTTRYYAGQVWAAQYFRNISPRRDPDEKNYLSFHHYAMRELPPFAIGPHYVVSADLVRFLANNRDDLRGVGTLEDVSVAFWLLSLLQVRPQHLESFNNLRFVRCRNSLISYAHISPKAMRLIHTNVVHERSFCRGFSFSAWDKQPLSGELPKSSSTERNRVERPLVFEWDLQCEPKARRGEITVSITAGGESAVAVYQPVLVPFVGFCRFLLNHTATVMSTTRIPSDFCYELRTHLTRALSEAVIETPPLAQFFFAPLNNLQQGVFSTAIFVRLTEMAAQRVGRLVECLVAAMYPDVHVYVVDEAEHALAFGVMEPDFSVSLASEPVPKPTSTMIPIVIATDATPPPSYSEQDKPTIWISPFDVAVSKRHIYLPLASLTFNYRVNHSPVDLLTPPDGIGVDERDFLVFECQRLRIIAEAATHVLIESLRGEDPSLAIQELCEDDELKAGATQSLFPLDESVARYAKFEFALVSDDRTSHSGQVSDRLVTAFLAGAIPIYYGDLQSVRCIFNPRAFVACNDFESLRACARHVIHLHRHQAQYDEMRQQPPMVNTTALVEIFSWHPDVITRLARPFDLPTMADRIKEMVDDWDVE